MKIAFVADVHIGNHKRFAGPVEAGINRRCRQVIDTLARALARACEEGCGAFVVLGDLYDTDRPSPQVEAAVQATFAAAPIMVIVEGGNHEMTSAAPGDHALGPLSPVARVVTTPELIELDEVLLALVPFHPGRMEDELEQHLNGILPRRRPRGARVLLGIHAGVRDETTPPWLEHASDSVPVELLRDLMRRRSLSGVVAGNWHERKAWDADAETILQVGTLAPTGFDNPTLVAHEPVEELPVGLYGFMAIYDSETGATTSLSVPGPRFFQAFGREAAQKLAELIWTKASSNEDDNYLEVQAGPEESKDCWTIVRNLKEAGYVVDGAVELDRTTQREAAMRASQAARSLDSFDAQLSVYVRKMDLAEGVDRARVLERARGYLRL